MNDNERVSDFLLSLRPEQSGVLGRMREYALSHHIPIVREETEDMLRVAARIAAPESILELGTAIGYSAIVLAQSSDAAVLTVESFDKRVLEARGWIEEAGLSSRIKVLEADIDEALGGLIPDEKTFDLIFLDAAKGQYLSWLKPILKRMHRGSLLIADNVLQDGTLMESRYLIERRARSTHRRMREFLFRIMHDDTLESAVIPVGDGIALSYMR